MLSSIYNANDCIAMNTYLKWYIKLSLIEIMTW